MARKVKAYDAMARGECEEGKESLIDFELKQLRGDETEPAEPPTLVSADMSREAERARVAGLESERDELAPKLEQARGRDCDFCRNWIHSALTGSCHGCWESVSTPRSWKAH